MLCLIQPDSFLLLGLAMVLVLAMALSASAAPDLEKPRTFSLLEVDRTFLPLGDLALDRAPVGGDQFAESNVLYRWTGAKTRGARVGRDRVLVTFVTGYGTNLSHRATVFVNVQLYLPDGTLLVEGFADVLPRGPGRFTFPVVGGTGVYADARGHISVKDIGETARIDLALLP